MLLGRESEQRAVESLVAGARVGQGAALVVCGEPGIGKTALLEHVVQVAEASQFRLLRATGTETERDLPFAGLAQLLHPVAARLGDLPAAQLAALEVALAVRPSASADRFAISASLLALLAHLAEDGPLGIVIDDAHLMDRPSAEAIAFSCRRLLVDCVFAVVAVRSGPRTVWDEAGLPGLRLRGLDPDPAGALIRSVPGPPLSPTALHRLLEVADGNPLALRELAARPDLLTDAQPGVPPPVPDVLAAAFAQRAQALDDRTREALALLAVAEGDLAIAGRAALAAGIELASLDQAEEVGLIRRSGSGTMTFVHPLARAGLYATASPAVRRRMHRLVAEALPSGKADLRAWHRAASVVGVDESVATQLDDVGRRARERAAYAVAATAYERAARLSVQPEAVTARLLAAGETAWFAGEDVRAAGHLRESLASDPTVAQRAHARGLLGLVGARTGNLADARDLLLAAAEEAVGEAPETTVLTAAEAVDACLYLLDVPGAGRAAQLLTHVLEHDAARVRGTVQGIGWVAVGMASTLSGDPPGPELQRGVALLSEPADPGVAAQSGWDLLGPMFLRDSETGRDLVGQALGRRRAAASLGTLPHLLFHVARSDAVSDRWSSAAAEYGEAVSLARELKQPVELAASLAGLSWLTGRQGRASTAEGLREEALALARVHHFRMAQAWCAFALGEQHLSSGDAESAVVCLTDLGEWLLTLGVRDPDLSPVPELVEALCRTGRRALAERSAVPFLEQSQRKGRPWSQARAARVRGMLATDPAQRDACFTAAATMHADTLDGFEAARSSLIHGELLRRDRRRTEARAVLRGALASFEALGATPWAERTLAELAASGETARRRDGGPVLELTPRELQIALLLGRGDSTRQAAQALFLSPKTVEYHLRHIYTKLGISSRAELRAALRTVPR